MDYYVIVGMVLVSFTVVMGFMWNIKKNTKDELETFQTLNLTITKLNENIEYMKELDSTRDKRIDKHGKEIDTLKDTQKNNEKILDRHEIRIGNLEEKVNKGA